MKTIQTSQTNNKPFRLNTMDDPTDDQLNFIMSQVGESARESSLKVNEIIRKRLQALHEQIAEMKLHRNPNETL